MPELRQLDGLLLRKTRKLVRIGKVLLGKGPAIALTVTDSESLPQLKKAKRLGAGLLEIRLDRFRSFDEARLIPKVQSLRRLRLPLIATVRSPKEGGGRALSDSKRLELFKKVLPWVEAIDLELSSTSLRKILVPLARRKGKRVILSYHNFHSTPSNGMLARLLRKGKQAGADLVKLAVTPKTKGDLARFLLLMHQHRDQHLIAVAMGRPGTPSRLLAPLFGSLLTYSFLSRSQAPGQLSLERLSEEMGIFTRKDVKAHRKSAQSF